MDKHFEQEWREKVSEVRASRFWRQVVSKPPLDPVPRAPEKPGWNEVLLDPRWGVSLEGPTAADGPARAGVDDLVRLLRANFSVGVKHRASSGLPRIVFALAPGWNRNGAARWDRSFHLAVSPDGVRVTAGSEGALLRASLYLTNYWRVRRGPALALGRRTVRPAIPLHIGADLWGGFTTTQAWIHGRENDTNFLELARMGVNFVPVMATLEEYCDAAPRPFRSLVSPGAEENRRRLAKLARRMARYDVHPLLMAYNPRLAEDHPVFRSAPSSRGALRDGKLFRVLCTSDPDTRRFLAGVWRSLFREIPELGGMLMISGGEGFYHCYMSTLGARDCPRCSRRDASAVVAELINTVARAVHRESPHALMVAWPYSASQAWSQDRDQVRFIRKLDRQHVIFQTEVEKDSVDWRPAGYAKRIWDYSIGCVSISRRCRSQRRLCSARRLPFSCKIEVNNSVECVNVPWLPVLENQRRIWENCRRLRPEGVHSRWMCYGSCKSPAEEIGYWAVWGRGTEFAAPDLALDAIARRDFGDRAAPAIRRAWRLFSEAIRHHPMLDYYKGTFFIGPCQPLTLDPDDTRKLDPVFFGHFYWAQQESSPSRKNALYEDTRPLFYDQPAWVAIARRGPKAGQDVALDELRVLAALWERGVDVLARARPLAPPACRARCEREWILGKYLAYTWRSGANVEEFLRIRNLVRSFSANGVLREGHRRENLRDLRRLRRIAQAELRIAREALDLVDRPAADFLDTRLRLDMGAASTADMLRAKIRQVTHLLKVALPGWARALKKW